MESLQCMNLCETSKATWSIMEVEGNPGTVNIDMRRRDNCHGQLTQTDKKCIISSGNVTDLMFLHMYG